MLRGTGPRGLRGILPRVGDPPWLIRPFLRVRRAQTRAYIEATDMRVVDDPSNDDPSYNRRNRIRHEVLPMLESFNPSLAMALCRLADAAREDDAIIEPLVEAAWGTYGRRSDEEVVIDQTARELGRGLRARLYQRALGGLGVDEVTAEMVERLDDLLGGETGRRAHLPPALLAQRTARAIVVAPRRDVPPLPASGIELPVPGQVRVAGWVIRAGPELGPGETSPRREEVAYGYRHAMRVPWMAALAARPGPLLVRRRIRGERWRPPKGSGSCRLKGTLNAWQVPIVERDAVPVIAAGGEVACLAGWGVDERFRPADGAERVIQLEIAWEGREPIGER
jgi:tRNA(Ile)-lysidine synthase